MYKLDYDRDAGIVRMVVEGFWDVPMVEALEAALLPLLKLARAEKGQALILSDSRNFPVQSAEVAAAFDRMETRIGALRDRMAMIVGSALSKMQGKRAVMGSTTAFFSDPEEAERWLRDR